jgi:hypothetical protein
MTTGQPIRYPSDRNKYNNEYMESLQLQINLNQQNLEVNRLYKETGQLPASTQMKDTRSNEEKLADVEYLKHQIMSDLKPIAEPMFASAVIQGVINSPLNVNNSLFRYLAQNASTFAQTLSRKYKFGIAGDANDVEIMVQFLEDAYNKTKNSFQSIKGYINSNTNEGNKTRSNILSENDTDNVKTELTNFLKNAQLAGSELNRRGIVFNQPIFNQIRDIVYFVTDIIDFLPTSEQMATVLKDFQTDISIRNPQPVDEDLIYTVFKLLRLLPRPSSIATLTDTINRAIRKENYNLLSQATNGLIQLFAEFATPANRAIMMQFINTFLTRADNEIRQDRDLNRINTVAEIKRMNQAQEDEKKAQRVYVVNPADDAVYVRGLFAPGGGGGDGGDDGGDGGLSSSSSSGYLSTLVAGGVSAYDALRQAGSNVANGISDASGILSGIIGSVSSSSESPRQYITHQVDYLTDDELNRLYNGIPLAHARVPLPPELQNLFNHPEYRRSQKEFACIEALVRAIGNGGNAYDPQNNRGNFGIAGLGLKKPRVKKGRGLYSPFGDNEINHKNLENNILTIRRKTKSNYMDLPSKHISKHMKNIIHNIVGGKIANYEDIHNLNDEERNYLHKIVSKSNLHDRLSVPAPSKDQAEKDNHQWEVMRGEIMAGNDSHELVKKFKLLTMKLTRQGLLPKNEVMDLFEDLVSLGY